MLSSHVQVFIILVDMGYPVCVEYFVTFIFDVISCFVPTEPLASDLKATKKYKVDVFQDCHIDISVD